MESHEDNSLVAAWIAMAKAAEGSPQAEENRWAYNLVNELCWKDPERMWNFILSVMADSESESVKGFLAAGPVEDLLANFPYEIIERVEREAKRDPRFASMLGGVWQNRMPDDVWQRVQAVWDRRGWYGIE